MAFDIDTVACVAEVNLNVLSPGTLLSSRYRIISVLGQGGMGAVYLAHMEALDGKKVAVKEMDLKGYSPTELSQAVKQFNREASFLANLDHPNLVPVTDFFVEGEKHYLVMSYIKGETLQQRMRSNGRAFTWDELKVWAESLVEVLDYLHTRNPPILFRDLKPSNIMLEESGRLRLIDFGIARTAQAGDRTSTFLQGTGTSGFSPIEQYGGDQSTDQRSDIYALGATLYYLLTGKVPPDAVARISQGKPLIPVAQYAPTTPTGVDAMLRRAMELKQYDRHSSMAEFLEEMRAIGSAFDGEGVTEDLATPGATKVRAGSEMAHQAAPASNGAEAPSKRIKIEMYPTAAPQSKPLLYTPWVVGLGSLCLAVAAILFVIGGPLSGGPADAKTGDGTASTPIPVVSPSTQKKPDTPMVQESSAQRDSDRPKPLSERNPYRYINPLQATPLPTKQPVTLEVTPKPVDSAPKEPTPKPRPKRPSIGEARYPKASAGYPKSRRPVSSAKATSPALPLTAPNPPEPSQQSHSSVTSAVKDPPNRRRPGAFPAPPPFPPGPPDGPNDESPLGY